MRAFVALVLPAVFETQTAELARGLKSVVEGRFLGPETYHVTLAFLGDVDERGVSDAMEAMDEACAGREGVMLSPDGLGKFGRSSDATLWLGLAASPALMDLAEDVREALRTRGVDFDDKPFRPHVTLARRARIPHGGMPALPFPDAAEAQLVALFKSTLSRDGAEYKELHSAKLGRI